MKHTHKFDDIGNCTGCNIVQCVSCKKKGYFRELNFYVCQDDKVRCSDCSKVLTTKIAQAGVPDKDGRVYTTRELVEQMVDLAKNDPKVVSAWMDQDSLWIVIAIEKKKWLDDPKGEKPNET